MWNQEFLDHLAVLSFIIGILNYEENLTQSDKDDMIEGLNQTMSGVLQRSEDDLEEQNEMLRDILDRLDRLEGKR